MADWIPGISQLKSGLQLMCGDVKGAAKTQENFVRQCPIVSQVTSTVQLIAGDEEGAIETQKQCLGTLSRVADSVPVVGHTKGLIHYAVGDDEGGDRAMKSSTRTCAVIGAGTAGFIGGGPVGAVLGIVAGVAADDTYTTATGTGLQQKFVTTDACKAEAKIQRPTILDVNGLYVATHCEGGASIYTGGGFKIEGPPGTIKTYYIVFQCRVQNDKFTEHTGPVNVGLALRVFDEKAIRPYGLLLKAN